MSQVVRTIFTSTVKKLDKKKRTVTFMGTKETPDRTGDIVRAMGIELENFQKNPVFLWNHNREIPAIGRILSVTPSQQGLMFEVKFASADVDPFADGIFKRFVEGFLSAVSIGFIPKDIEPIFSNNGMLLGLDIIRSELLELSAVNVPAHQDALAASMDKKYEKLLTDYDTKTEAVQLEEYRKSLEGTFTQKEPDMEKLAELEALVTELTAQVKAQGETIDEQAVTIKSLITLRETVDFSQQVMESFNKSVVSLMNGTKDLKTPASEGDGSTPKSPTIDASQLMNTLNDALSRFKEKAFTPSK